MKELEMSRSEIRQTTILAGMIINQAMADKAVGVLQAKHFTTEKYKKLFATIVKMCQRSKPVGLCEVAENLEGGCSYSDLAEIIDRNVTSVHFDFVLSRHIEEHARAESAFILAESAKNLGGASDAVDMQHVIHEMNQKLQSVAEKSMIEQADETPAQIAEREIQRIEKDGHSVRWIFPAEKMQRLTEGIGRGEFIVLAARPSVGKTTFVLNWCNWLGCDASILFLSLEMSKQEITRSLMRIATRKPLSRDASPSEIRKAAESIQRLNIRIEEASGAKASNIAASIRQQNNKRKVDIVVIDYLQRIRGEGKSRYEDMTEISNDLADLAHGSKITVVALAQLNRASEAAADHRPKMSHLRESGAIEQDADMIFLMSRLNNEIGRDGGDEPINVELAKNRNGKVGSIQFLFRKSEGTFSEIEG